MIPGFECKNPKWVIEDVAIDVEYKSPRFGWVTYTVVNNSGEQRMQMVWDALIFGEAGPIAPADPV